MLSKFDISTYLWLDHESVGSPTSHLVSLKHFRDEVIQPSLRALDTKIDELRRSDEPGVEFVVDDLGAIFQSTVGSYLLAVQAMWERGLRAMPVSRAKSLDLAKEVDGLRRAKWEILQGRFEFLLGVPITAFDSFEDLDLLQCFGNAIRHGDGHAARKLHERCPNLWWGWFVPGEEVVAGPFRFTVPGDSEKHPSIEDITLKECVLTQMVQSVLWFWEDVELMRCNSFKRKHPSVEKKLGGWDAAREARPDQRRWRPGDSLWVES